MQNFYYYFYERTPIIPQSWDENNNKLCNNMVLEHCPFSLESLIKKHTEDQNMGAIQSITPLFALQVD